MVGIDLQYRCLFGMQLLVYACLHQAFSFDSRRKDNASLWIIHGLFHAFLCIVDNWNEMCVIMMYKFSGCHVNKFCCFFASNDRFSRKVGRFFAKSGRDSVVKFRLNSADLWVNSVNLSASSTEFWVSQIFMLLSRPNRVSVDFYRISPNLADFFENRWDRLQPIFFCFRRILKPCDTPWLYALRPVMRFQGPGHEISGPDEIIYEGSFVSLYINIDMHIFIV
jgi:hypothetical protein